ncbi:hypothetical protein MBLNU230_g3150t1 [Neophaeotheca triangularis]
MYTITNIYVLAAFGTIGGALFGFDISSMSAWVDADQYRDYFNTPDANLQGLITGLMSIGSFIGALAAGFIADRLGRKMALSIASVIWVIGAVLQCSAQNVAHLIVGRVVSGLAIGITSSQVCVYLAELAPGAIRGRIVGLQQWAIEWGILIMYLICYGCTFVDGPASFRIAWGVQGIPGFILFGALFFFPESPRWLAGQERWEECLKTLADLHAKGDEYDPKVQAEYEEVKEAVRIAAESSELSVLGLFGKNMWWRTMCGMTVQMWQQLLGGNVAMYYIVYVFRMAGLDSGASLYSAIIQYVIFLVTTGGILPFIDKFSRRHLLMGGAIACCIIHFIIAALMASYGYEVSDIGGNENLTWILRDDAGDESRAIIALSYIFVGIYGFTWAPIGWIYCSEVFPLKWRAKGVGLSAATNWIFNFALAYFVSPAFTNIQWRTYIIFGVFCFVMTFQIFFTYPETRGKTLEEIDLIFDKKVRPWRSANVTTDYADRVAAIEGKQGSVDDGDKTGRQEHKEDV